jgi:hypothetical protein
MKTQERVREMAVQNYNNTPVGISGVSQPQYLALEQLVKHSWSVERRLWSNERLVHLEFHGNVRREPR